MSWGGSSGDVRWTRPSSEAVAAAVTGLTDYAAELGAQLPVPGGTWAVVDRAGVVASATWGVADIGTGEPTRLEHRFEIGSISKVITAIVVHQLVDESLIDLDRPVVDVVPWLDLGSPHAALTPRHLLSHTGGLVLGADAMPDELAQVWAMRDLVRSGEPGERFHYSNLGFMVLGQLVAHVTGRPFAEVVHERVLVPLGAGGARADIRHADRSTMATGHWPLHDDRMWAPGDPVSPATWFEVSAADGHVAATVEELGTLASFLLGDGSVDVRPAGGESTDSSVGVPARLLSPESMDRFVSPWAPGGEGVCVWNGTPEVEESRYGLGINVELIDGHHVVTHGGGMVGYATFLLADRDAGVGVVVLTNGTGEQPLAHAFARVVHHVMVALGEGRPAPELPDPSAALRGAEIAPALLGTFEGTAYDGTSLRLTVREGADGRVEVVTRGVASAGDREAETVGRLLRTWNDRHATDHPDLRTFPLTPDGDRWLVGPYVLTSVATEASGPATDGIEDPREPVPALDPQLLAVVGHYRSWSPWYPSFRVVARDGGLVLIAPGGVEAPGDDEALVELEPGVFRIGADPWLPERLHVGPVVDGHAVTVTRDGCIYSRHFTP
jgi:CubicO group peptidase (beta-lactamase class C family)